jgi:uroporphyrinogen III methyltransferase/synthase
VGKGKVYLLGAGPGNPDLITVRGLACLRRADVVIYDRLVSRSLLAETPPNCERIYSGKEGGGPHAMIQEAISQLLVERALAGKTVCRLKGGDPFVFGRGGEEAEILRQAGVPYEIIPGVTSGVGALAYAGIPVTHRGLASAVAFVTGHEAAELSAGVDWAGLASSSVTLVCYMGLGRLNEVRDELVQNGRPPDTPAAVIHWGTKAEQQVVTAPLSELPERASGMRQPALIVIGQVVAMREIIRWAEERPLFGQRILIPFAGEQAEALADAMRELGGEPWLYPRRYCLPQLHETQILREEIAAGHMHQVYFNSVQGLDSLVQTLGPLETLRGIRFSCSAPEVAAALDMRGCSAEASGLPAGELLRM